jgi:hypothetical protein
MRDPPCAASRVGVGANCAGTTCRDVDANGGVPNVFTDDEALPNFPSSTKCR